MAFSRLAALLALSQQTTRGEQSGVLQNRTAPDSEPCLICGPRQGGMGVNSHRGLFLPPYWGQGPGNARQWVMGLEALSRNHVIKSYCGMFCWVGVGREARGLGMYMDWHRGRRGGWSGLSPAGIPHASPSLPQEAFPKILTLCRMHLHIG